MVRYLLMCSVLMLFCNSFVFAISDLPRAKDAERKVEEFHAFLIDVMKQGQERGCAFRYSLLLPEIEERFDVALISRIVLGSWWRKISVDEKLDFIKLFTRYTAATYAERFAHLNNTMFRTVSSELSRKERALVETILSSEGHEDVRLTYICRKSADGWKIVGVSARGVNDLSLKRAEYNDYIKKYGFKTLMGMLEKKITSCNSL